MRGTELSGLETTIQKTHEWLGDIMNAIGADDAHIAYGALRAVLHALRDRLTVDEAVQLGAQLPMLIRGLYYEGWCPRGKPAKTHKAEFLDAIRHQFPGPDRLHPEVLARAVLKVLSRHVSPGEIRDVKAILPAELRDLWPGQGVHPSS
jgi:uncharacterized protein (DUF2267 family)